MTELSLGQKAMQAIGAVPPAPQPLTPPGVYHYERLVGDWPTRFHLRVDPDGGGLLLANAAEAAYLSPVGVNMVRGVLEGQGDEQLLATIKQSFRGASVTEMVADLAEIHRLLADLSAPGDNYPVTNLDDPRVSVWSRALAAPFRADVVQGDPTTSHDLLLRLWGAGIPHVTFLVQPELAASDLPRLVEAAEDIGMVAGLRSLASWLSPEIIEQTALAGLDHLDLLYVSNSPQTHDAIAGEGDRDQALAAFQQCHDLELCPVAQVPIVQSNVDDVEEIIGFLAERQVTNLCFFAVACLDEDKPAQEAGALPARALPQVAAVISEAAEESQTRFLWAPSVRFDPDKSLAKQLRRGPRTAGDVAVRVEADGRVFPPRGARTCAGNLLDQPWDALWNHECFTRYRERLQAPTRCSDCPDLEICLADCPKNPQGWSDDSAAGCAAPESESIEAETQGGEDQ